MFETIKYFSQFFFIVHEIVYTMRLIMLNSSLDFSLQL